MLSLHYKVASLSSSSHWERGKASNQNTSVKARSSREVFGKSLKALKYECALKLSGHSCSTDKIQEEKKQRVYFITIGVQTKSLHWDVSISGLGVYSNSVNLLRPICLLLLLSHFSRVRLCVTPETAAHQAPLSLGFSRQEH